MKKVILVLMVIIIIFSFTSCFPGANDPDEIESMLNSFNHSENYVILTHFQLVVRGKHYERSEIKYNGKDTEIVFLEENGFYSYAYSKEDSSIEFLFTTYDNFEVTKLGEMTLPTTEFVHSYFYNNCFWIRMYANPDDEVDFIHYCWSTLEKTGHFVDNYDWYNRLPDYNRSSDYTFSYKSSLFIEELKIVNNDTGVEKKINKSILKTFEEGIKISNSNSRTVFRPDRVYVVDDDIYFISSFGVGPLSTTAYYIYIVKWNFNTEECTFVTSTHFDYYQEWVDDMIIINQ